MSPTTSDRAGGAATDEAPGTRLREPRQMAKSKVPPVASRAASFFVRLTLIATAGVAR
jgi:hypothetical protein